MKGDLSVLFSDTLTYFGWKDEMETAIGSGSGGSCSLETGWVQGFLGLVQAVFDSYYSYYEKQ